MRFSSSIITLFALNLPLALVAAGGDKVEVEVLHAVECNRKTQRGDSIEVCRTSVALTTSFVLMAICETDEPPETGPLPRHAGV